MPENSAMPPKDPGVGGNNPPPKYWQRLGDVIKRLPDTPPGKGA